MPRTRRVSEILGNLKEQSVSALLSEANDTHVADLLARVYRIERGAVMLA